MAWSVKFRGSPIVFDPATFTLEESEHRRKILATVTEPDNYDNLGAAAWVTLRRTDQSVSWEQFRAEMTRGALDALEEVEDSSPEV